MKINSNLRTALLQTGIAIALLLVTPMMMYVFTRDFTDSTRALCSLAPVLTTNYIFFMVNYWWLVPSLFQKGRKTLYILINILLIVFLIVLPFFILTYHSDVPWHEKNIILFLATAGFMTLMFFSGSAMLALALRNAKRTRELKEQMEEEKRRHTEAELVWLKNQLNPHFLFNTLNNISALVAFDADRAQDCISRLSDLLRYAMYESAKPLVSLPMEVDFMKDYISLMGLRCNSRTTVSTSFEVNSPTAHIAPLLLISIIENAFKHGVSANRPSEIAISLLEKDGTFTFECSNTNHAKGTDDNSGSGIGLINMRRRLDLLYAGRYEWTQTDTPERFTITITIKL